MASITMTRRQIIKAVMAALLTGSSRIHVHAASSEGNLTIGRSPIRLKVAAIQMTPKLADVESNLNQAEQLIREAILKKAQWIILPEMFTTAAAFHPDMLDAIQPIDGKPMQLLKRLAREGNAHIGGSFLARHDKGVFNTFVLASPDGSITQHNKDFPTYWENCYYQKGDDDGLLNTSIGPVGSVLCWEFIRSETARRLSDKVRMVVGGSCWWTLPDDAAADSPYRTANLSMLQQAPVRMATMLGVPVVHGSHAGTFEGYFSPDLEDVPYNSAYLGETMIVDASGQVLARRSGSEGAGIITAEIQLHDNTAPSEPIPERFWTPEEMPQDWKDSWTRWFDTGADYYEMVTAQYLETGVINEYVPMYLR